MERQKSFSWKPTRFLVFSFTISSFIFFLTFFTTWLFKSTPPLLQQTSFEFSKVSLDLGSSKILPLQTFHGFTRNLSVNGFKDSILRDTQFRKLENDSIGIMHNGFEVLNGEGDEDDSDNVEAPESSTEEIQVIAREEVAEKQNEVPSEGLSEEKGSNDASGENFETLNFEGIKKRRERECDVTKGRWVYDENYPLYSNRSCPFIDEGFDCTGNGRLDKDYMKWRWQPQDCVIPRFNATNMLDLIREKRLVFVGDSINRNQWESLLCMLMGAIKDPKRVYETRGRRITKGKGQYSFKFVDYGCTVEYYVTHFLVQESKSRVGRRRVQTLRIDAIDHGSSRWRGADLLIFNTGHWWSHFKTKAGINYYQEGSVLHPKLDASTAFRRALTTWGSWVDKNTNPRKTRVFFRSSAPAHFRGGQWNSGGHCGEATQPLNKTSTADNSEKNTITSDTIKQMKTPVTFLDITSLSGFRIDGHPSVYGKKPEKDYRSKIQDCSHWCLPGVPDTWNELLYFHLLSAKGFSNAL